MYWKDEYKDTFNKIVALVWSFHTEGEVTLGEEYLEFLYLELRSLEVYNNFSLEKEDIEQELNLIWIQRKQEWESKDREIPLLEFLTKKSVYDIRVWYRKQVISMSYYPYTEEDYPLSQNNVRMLTLDVKFLIQGTRFYPFSKLSPYERYLLFLKFNNEKTIVEMSQVLQKDRSVVSKQLATTIKKLRRLNYHASQNTR